MCARHSTTGLRRAQFQGAVAPINSSTGRLGSRPSPLTDVYLDWQLEPEPHRLQRVLGDSVGWQDAVLGEAALPLRARLQS